MGQLRRMLIQQQQRDLQFVEYIESTGTQYIDSGISHTDGNVFEFEVETTEASNSFYLVDGITQVGMYDSLYGTNTSVGIFKFTVVCNDNDTLVGSLVTNETNGTTRTNSSTSSVSKSYNNYLFALNSKNTAKYFGKTRLHYFRVKNGSSIVLNLVPAIYKGVPCMWETVEGKPYYNSGTGEFLTGDVIDLRFYEYLESNGTQYIDTGVIPNDTDAIDLKFIVPTFNTASAINCVLGARMGYEMPLLRFVVNKINYLLQCDYGNNYNVIGLKTNILDTLLELSFSRAEIVVNGSSMSITEDDYDECTKTMYMFTLNGEESSGQSFSNSRIYHCKMKKDGIVIRDFIPCSYNGEFGMFDLTEFKFYGNIGTGVFTVGKEVKHSFV